MRKSREMEARAREEAAKDKIALEKAKESVLPADVAAELTAMLQKQADEAAGEAIHYADRMATEVENSVDAANSAKHFRECRVAQAKARRLLDALAKVGGPEDDD